MKKNKNQLIQPEQYFQALFEKAPLPYQSLDAQGHILDVNQAWLEKMGYERQEIIGRWFGDFLSKEYHGIFMERFPCFKSLGMVSGVEFSMRRKDGTFFLGSFEGKIDKDEQGDFKRTHCIFTDITQQKAVENNLTKAKEKAERKALELNNVQQITHIGSWYLDLATNEVSWTEELYKMYGFDSALPPPPYTEHMKLFTPESWEILSTSLAMTAETGIPYELELKTIRKDKSNGWLWCRGEAVFDQNKKIIGLWGAAQDITERKHAERKLVDSEEKYKSLFSRMMNGFALHKIITDQSGKPIDYEFIEINDSFEQMTGVKKDNVIGKRVTAIFPGIDNDLADWIGIYGDVAINGKDIKFEQYSEPLQKWFSISAYSPNKGYFATVIEDITERKLAEEELKKIEWMLTSKPLLENIIEDQGYGDLTVLNRDGLIARSIDKSTLRDIVAEYLNLLKTSSAIYEKNGDYAYGIFCSGWCRLLDNASRKLCRTDDNAAALAGGKWLCHESCWKDCSKRAIDSRSPVDIECSGGIHLYAVPIFSAGEVIGAINFGYGEPPRDVARLRTLADSYGLDLEKLIQEADAYASRPAYMVELSKQRLLSSARLIGIMVEQKQIELELVETAERFKALHNASFGGIAIHEKGKIFECNQGLAEMTGYSVDELTGGMDGLLLIAPEHREMVMNKIVTGYEKPYEANGLRKNGEQFPMRLEARNVPYKGKNVRTVEFRDITEQKKAEKALQESENNLRSVIDSTPFPVAVVDLEDTNIKYWSKSALIIFGHTAPTAEAWYQMAYPDHKYRGEAISRWKTFLEIAKKSGETVNTGEYLVTCKNGSVLTCEIYAKFTDKNLIVTFNDITEQKKIEQQEKEIFAARAAAEMEKQKAAELFKAYEELKAMQEQLLQSEKMASIGQLGAGIAHELNSPLAGILSLLQSYKKEKDLNSEEYEDLGEMEKAAEHMVRIIKGLNIFSRQSTGEIEDVDCNEAINSVLGFTEYQFKQKHVKIEIKLNPDLWKIRANKNQIQQIIINMISNASDALASGGAFKIATNNFKMNNKDYVEMLFEDNGSGIKAEYLKKIFDPFFTTKRPGGGIGLGLSIVYKIVESHKGLITFDSSEGKGTIFTVRFPVN